MRKLKRMLVAVFLLLNSAVLYSQTTVSGVVTSSADNKPIQGVSVTIKVTKRGTQTDADGRFTLAVSKGEVLEFRGVGVYNAISHSWRQFYYQSSSVRLKQATW